MSRSPQSLGSLKRHGSDCPATLTRVLTITWLADAAVLISMQLDPTSANPTFLLANAMIWGLTAIASLVLTGGRHRSWIFFLPISAITAARGLASIN